MTDTNELLSIINEALAELKAEDIITLDVRHLTSITDHMIFCSGRSRRQVKSIADKVFESAKAKGYRPLSMQGEQIAEWILVDLGDVIVHIFLPETRAFYELEKLWNVPAVHSAHA